MEQCKTDPCVFRPIREGKVVLILTIHVDDMAVAGPRDEVDKLLEVLNEDFTTNYPWRDFLPYGLCVLRRIWSCLAGGERLGYICVGVNTLLKCKCYGGSMQICVKYNDGLWVLRYE